jgi:hypothetical protein
MRFDLFLTYFPDLLRYSGGLIYARLVTGAHTRFTLVCAPGMS